MKSEASVRLLSGTTTVAPSISTNVIERVKKKIGQPINQNVRILRVNCKDFVVVSKYRCFSKNFLLPFQRESKPINI